LAVVELNNVWKSFGSTVALRGINIEIDEGRVFGIIGPNGAGKTTTLRIISTLVKPDKGTAKVFGYDTVRDKDKIREILSYLPEDAGLYHRLTGWENLLYFAMIYAETPEEAEKIAKRGAEISGLSEMDLHRRSGEYSKGMSRRIAIARTLMTNAKLVILDEPTSGLDVFSAVAIRKIIKKYAKDRGITVIISSHNMLEVSYLCDEVALISKGKIIARGTPNEIVEMAKAENLEEAFIKLAGE